MGPEIGHPATIDDGAGVAAVARAILTSAAAFVFPGGSEWLRELPDCTVRAASFDAYVRLQEDRLDHRTEDCRTMVVVRFGAAGQPLPKDPWSLRVRVNWPGRADRLPDASPLSSRSLRRGLRWARRTTRRGLATPGDRAPRGRVPWGRHDSLWITNANAGGSEIQTVDLEAQVGLFLLQTELVPQDGVVRDHLIAYLRAQFRWRGVEDPDTAVYEVYAHLLKHKWWADDWRAWRKLIRRGIDGLVRAQTPRQHSDVNLSPDEQGRLTVDQFAKSCHRSRSSVYESIRAGTLPLASQDGDRRYMIAAALVPHVATPLRRSALVRALIRQGRSAAAAEKWVYRQEQRGQSLLQIATTAARPSSAARKRGGHSQREQD